MAAAALEVARAIALDVALSGDDRLLRETAIKLAFEHGDRGARQRIVRDWLHGAKSLGGTMKQTNGRGGGDAPELAAFSLSIKEASSNGDAINFTAALTGGVFEQNAREDPMIGSFLGTQLSIGNAHCSIVADLQPDQTFLGTLTCDDFMNSCKGCRREGTAQIVIPVAAGLFAPIDQDRDGAGETASLAALVGTWSGQYSCQGHEPGTMTWGISAASPTELEIKQRAAGSSWSSRVTATYDAGKQSYELKGNTGTTIIKLSDEGRGLVGRYDDRSECQSFHLTRQ